MRPQDQLLAMLESRPEVSTVDILREVPMTTPAKAILRLRKKLNAQGKDIVNLAPAGEVARYSIVKIGQLEMRF